MSKLTKRGVQISLGLFWLLDGSLQLQHKMFSSNFVNQVVQPAIQGQPGFLRVLMNYGTHLFLLSPVIFNILFALTQLTLGVLILLRRTTKIGLMLSIPWALIVWIFGEGLGGILSGHTLLLMGAPGAAVLYAILAMATISTSHKQKKQVAFWLALVWVFLWSAGTVYQLLPGQNSTSDISSIIGANSVAAPKWLASIDIHTANYINNFGGRNSSQSTPAQSGNPMSMTNAQMVHMTSEINTSSGSNPSFLFILLLAGLQFCIGIGVLFPGMRRRLAISAGICLSLIFWIVGESLGGYFTGFATDPNSGPLFVILGLAILGCSDLDFQLSKFGVKIERLFLGESNPDYRDEIIYIPEE